MSNSIPGRPDPSEYLAYFDTYISLVPEEEILPALNSQISELTEALSGITDEQASTVHAPYAWTIKQVIGHCNDTERIFGYRACRFAALDPTPLPGFDQDLYVATTDYSSLSLQQLLDEFVAIRNSNVLMFARQNTDGWMRSGIADGKNMSVRAAAYICVGHMRHHMAIIAKRLQG